MDLTPYRHSPAKGMPAGLDQRSPLPAGGGVFGPGKAPCRRPRRTTAPDDVRPAQQGIGPALLRRSPGRGGVDDHRGHRAVIPILESFPVHPGTVEPSESRTSRSLSAADRRGGPRSTARRTGCEASRYVELAQDRVHPTPFPITSTTHFVAAQGVA